MAAATTSALSDSIPATDRRVVSLAVLSGVLRGLAPSSLTSPHETLAAIADSQGDTSSADSFRAMEVCTRAIEEFVAPAMEWVSSRYSTPGRSTPSLSDALLSSPSPPELCGERRVRLGQYIYCSSHFDTIQSIWRTRNPAYDILQRLSHPGALSGLPAVLDPEAIVREIVGPSLEDSIDAVVASLAHIDSCCEQS